MRTSVLAVLVSSLSVMICAPAVAQSVPPPAGFGKPAPLPPANGTGQVTFNHAGTVVTLPLNKIEIDKPTPDMFMVSLSYADAAQENTLSLAFSSMPKLGANDPRMVTGFMVKTKAHGLSRHAANKTKCVFVISRVNAQETAGTISCKGMTDATSYEAASDVTDVQFDGKIKAK